MRKLERQVAEQLHRGVISILYWRCGISSAGYQSPWRRDNFNSLLEMHRGAGSALQLQGLRISILYWRCRTLEELATSSATREDFNSLLEMRSNPDPPGTARCPPPPNFNSLLEMLQECKWYEERRYLNISILYWRCPNSKPSGPTGGRGLGISILYWRCRPTLPATSPSG